CTGQIANGSPLPMDPNHLDGTCSAAAATLVCQSGVCDNDNNCGYKDAGGSCSIDDATGCRSGICSVAGTCLTSGGCNADGDCAPGSWCNISEHSCLAQIG